MSPHIREIRIYPIKSLDPVAVAGAAVLPGGALEDDRRWVLVDERERAVTGKTEPDIQRIRSDFDLETGSVRLWTGREETSESFALDDRTAIGDWISTHLGRTVRLVEAPPGGKPDDNEAPGPTMISEATLETVAGWFRGMEVEEARRRFRANIEIAGVPAFWEDQLMGPQLAETQSFRIGSTRWLGINPCQRCAVPTRDSRSGDPDWSFSKRFREMREATLPDWAHPARFTHFYRLAINTRAEGAVVSGARIHVGDGIAIGSVQQGSSAPDRRG